MPRALSSTWGTMCWTSRACPTKGLRIVEECQVSSWVDSACHACWCAKRLRTNRKNCLVTKCVCQGHSDLSLELRRM
jgi:hypothetical protein